MANNIILRFTDEQRQPSPSFTVGINERNTDLTLTFFGEGSSQYNGYIQQNFLYLLEHFCNYVPPSSPTEGQLWYDAVSSELKVATVDRPYAPATPPSSTYPNGIPEQPATYFWKSVGAPIISSTEPSETAYLWFDSTSNVLKVFDLYQYKPVTDHVVSLSGGNITGNLTVQGNLETNNTMITTGTITLSSLVTDSIDFENPFALTSGSNALTSTTTLLTLTSQQDIRITFDSNNSSTSEELSIRYVGVSDPLLSFSENSIIVSGTIASINTTGVISQLGVPSLTANSTDAARNVDLTSISATSPTNLISLTGGTFTGSVTTSAIQETTDVNSVWFSDPLVSAGVRVLGAQLRHVPNRLLIYHTPTLAPSFTTEPVPSTVAQIIMDFNAVTKDLYLTSSLARIKNLADPINNTDGLNLQTVQQYRTTVLNEAAASLVAIDDTGPKAWVQFKHTGTLRTNAYNASVSRINQGEYIITLNTGALFTSPGTQNQVAVVVSSAFDTNFTTNRQSIVNQEVTKTSPTQFTYKMTRLQPIQFDNDDCENWTYYEAAGDDEEINIMIFW